MAWTWNEPPNSTDSCGPGYLVNAQSDFVGPLPTGSYMQVELRGPDDATSVASADAYVSSTLGVFQMGWSDISHDIRVSPADHISLQGATGYLHAELYDDTSTLLSSSTKQCVLDFTRGIAAHAFRCSLWLYYHPPANIATILADLSTRYVNAP